MKILIKYISFFTLLILMQSVSIAAEANNISADEALVRLKDGNHHYITMHLKHPDQSKKRRHELLRGQHPFVIVLSCSDSRVPPEVIFDQGLGDIFEIRNAGNVLDEHVIGSIEYAVVHCGVKLVVVLSHEDCGAVTAAIKNNKESKYIESLTESIKPAIPQKTKKTVKDLITETAKNNAVLSVSTIIKSDPIISDYVLNHGVKVIPAFYYLDSGFVEFLN